MARLFDHKYMLELAEYASVPVINGLTDYNHPCQAAADALTIQENFGGLKGIKVTYVGDGNNVAVSLMHICAKLGADFTIANPEGYGIDDKAIQLGKDFAAKSGSSIKQINDPVEAVAKTQVIYTDTWVSMGQDEETAQRRKVFPPYQVNESLLANADKDVIVMHCLPAHRGEEITNEVADGPHSRLFPQAHNRLHAQKAILVKLLN
jgi:ornithine carbamoyltransferase